MAKRKRALFLINSLAGGGAERVMCTLLRHSEAERAEFDIALAVLDKEAAGNVPPDWVDFRQLDCRFSLPRSILAVRQVYADFKPDVSLSFLTRANISSVVGASTPCVISERTHTSTHFSKGLRGAATRTVVRAIYPRAARVIAVSDGVASDLRENFAVPADRIVSIPNPIDVEAIRSLARQPLPIEVGGPFIVSVGRLVKVKNFALLMRGFALAGGDRKLVIVGEGEERSALEQLARDLGIADRVLLPGHIQNPYPLMAVADLFVLTSDYEGYPNALVEAMALGRAVIATNCDSGPSQILAGLPRHAVSGITFAENGVLVPVDDENAMAEAIRALNDETRRTDYGAKATARAASFNVAAIKDRYWSVLREAMATAPAPQR